MEIEKSPPEIAKKLWNIVRIVFYMMRKGIAKSKIMLDLHTLLKRGKIASKAAIGNLLMLHHHHHHNNNYYSALTCRSNDINASFVSPREYEFSCSNSPVVYGLSKRRNHRHHRPEELKVMHKVLDILNRYDVVEASSPLPGFGRSPAGRQLRVTDSPFPVKDPEEKHDQVDRDCEEFIKNFYKDLKNQKRIAAGVESPSPYHVWAR
ncbi:hypothetical protein Salat_1060600 [Sesamum alatum]|uniref:Avr9/Cf-9 rapidly elicited protein 146 n=1 Tax=Sesamum alatum TaxID=300844 RepID=A0AAE1YMY9_9LAMI|nr:hypothetical protein Salat_1060600 [Sesamum alatum]